MKLSSNRFKSWFLSRQPWRPLRHALRLDALPPGMRRLVAGVIGGTVLLFGIAMIVLPGPAFVVIPLGLAILATEFFWARHILRKARGLFRWSSRRRFFRRKKPPVVPFVSRA